MELVECWPQYVDVRGGKKPFFVPKSAIVQIIFIAFYVPTRTGCFSQRILVWIFRISSTGFLIFGGFQFAVVRFISTFCCWKGFFSFVFKNYIFNIIFINFWVRIFGFGNFPVQDLGSGWNFWMEILMGSGRKFTH